MKPPSVGRFAPSPSGPLHAGDFIVPSGRSDGLGVAVAPAALALEQLARIAGRIWTSDLADGTRLATVAVGFDGANATVQQL